MQDFQKRVIDEKAELDAKRERLGSFKNTDVFARLPWQEQERLNTQAHIMTMYSAVLGERIAESDRLRGADKDAARYRWLRVHGELLIEEDNRALEKIKSSGAG